MGRRGEARGSAACTETGRVSTVYFFSTPRARGGAYLFLVYTEGPERAAKEADARIGKAARKVMQ
jgi:hypothetical protein